MSALTWLGFAMIKKPLEGGGMGDVPNPAFGALDNLSIALAVLVVVVLIAKYTKGFFANIAVLLGIIFGDSRWISYSLIGVGVLLAIIDAKYVKSHGDS